MQGITMGWKKVDRDLIDRGPKGKGKVTVMTEQKTTNGLKQMNTRTSSLRKDMRKLHGRL